VYLAEIAPPGRKGFFVSWQSASQQVAVALAAVIGMALTYNLSADSMNRWGWRVPLLVGCLIIPVLFVLRRTLDETEEFVARKHHPSTSEIVRTVAANWRLVGLGVMLTAMTTVSFYMITAYTPTFGSTVLHLANTRVQFVILCVAISNFTWLPIVGALSDRIGRQPILLVVTILTLVTAYPALSWLVSSPSIGRMLVVELWLSCMFGSYNGAMVVYLTEIMPPDVRTSGFSVAYSLATAIFGGFTPAICTYLIEVSGNSAIPGLWLSFAAALGLLAAVMLAGRMSSGVASIGG
jgi:MFS family permease